LDACGVCAGDGVLAACACEDTSALNSDGCCDEVEDLGCGCGVPGPSGCDSTCGSILELDACGVCAGDGVLAACACEYTSALNSDGCCDDVEDLGCGCGQAEPNACDSCDASIVDLGCGCGVAGPNACGSCDGSINDNDNDGVCSDVDNCPNQANADQEDLDDDGLGDVCDSATCGNGVLEAGEECDWGEDASTDTCGVECQWECEGTVLDQPACLLGVCDDPGLSGSWYMKEAISVPAGQTKTFCVPVMAPLVPQQPKRIEFSLFDGTNRGCGYVILSIVPSHPAQEPYQNSLPSYSVGKKYNARKYINGAWDPLGNPNGAARGIYKLQISRPANANDTCDYFWLGWKADWTDWD
jgi:hypothetical protein